MDAIAARPGHRLTALLMGGALVGKVLGFARELLMAQIIGASLVADSFRGAITAVLLPLVLLQSEGLPAILIPMHRTWQQQGRAPQQLAAITIALTLTAALFMAVIQLLGPRWVAMIVGGFGPEAQALTLDFVRIMALAMPASTLINCLAAGEIALGRSRLTSIRSALLNVAVIAGLVLLAATGRPIVLACSFAFAFNALAAWGLWTLGREGVLNPAGLTPSAVLASGMEYLRRLRPMLIHPLAEQGQGWLERLMASGLGVGAVASLDYARTLSDSAVLLVSQPVGLAVLSRAPATDVQGQMEAIARPILALALPGSVFLAMFAPDVVTLVFARGAFGERAVLLTSQALSGIAIGLWAATLGWILLRMLNSRGRNMHAALVLAAAYSVNAGCNLLSGSWQDAAGQGVLILGLGEAARGLVLLTGTAIALGCGLGLLRLIALAALPALIMGLAALQIHNEVSGSVARLALGSAAGAACVALGLAILMPGLRRAWLRRISSGALPKRSG